MKIRVMNKLGHTDPYQLPHANQRQKTQRRTLNHPTYSAASLAPSSEYFPTAALPQHRLKGSRQAIIKDFFNRFEANCSIEYVRVERELPQLCRRLAPILADKEYSLSATPSSDEYQFSFKKVQDSTSIIRNNTQLPTALSSINRGPYFLQVSNRPKIKLRKFHSLIAIKGGSFLEGIQQPSQTGMRRNQSMAKRGIIRLVDAGRERNLTENEEEVVRVKGRGTFEEFEEEKYRLNRIREELNEIYNAKRSTKRVNLSKFQNHF